MHKNILIALGCLTFAGCSQQGANSFELGGIWHEYARAIDNNRGNAVVDLVSSDTIEHYKFLRASALDGVRNKSKLTVTDEVAIRFLRAHHKRSTLAKLSGRDTLSLLVRNDVVSIPGMTKFTFDQFDADNGQAKAKIKTDDPATEYEIGFDKERGKWLIDDGPLRKSREWVLAERIISYGADRDKVINELSKSVGIENPEMDNIREPMSG